MSYTETLRQAAAVLDEEWLRTTAKISICENEAVKNRWEDLARALALGAEALRKSADGMGVRR